MKSFEIDVSGEDIFSKDYSIVVADKNNLVKGFKFNQKLIQILRARQGEGKYRYSLSSKGKSLLRVRLYCIIIYYIFKNIGIRGEEIALEVCRDFQGHESDITSNLKYLLGEKLDLKTNFRYLRLSKNSNADKYSRLMREDIKNKMNCYVDIDLNDIEKYLVK